MPDDEPITPTDTSNDLAPIGAAFMSILAEAASRTAEAFADNDAMNAFARFTAFHGLIEQTGDLLTEASIKMVMRQIPDGGPETIDALDKLTRAEYDRYTEPMLQAAKHVISLMDNDALSTLGEQVARQENPAVRELYDRIAKEVTTA